MTRRKSCEHGVLSPGACELCDPPAVLVKSGAADPDLPCRYGCSCGASWNASAPLTGKERLCGPYCRPNLFPLKKGR